MTYAPGTRVVAISHSKDGVVHIFGHGVYEGDFPYEDVTGTSPFLAGGAAHLAYIERCIADDTLPMLNPRIRLDSGQFVWGCECWWGDEEGFEKKYKDATIVVDNIDEVKASTHGHGVPDMVRGSS
jgi:hypothetical protein